MQGLFFSCKQQYDDACYCAYTIMYNIILFGLVRWNVTVYTKKSLHL